MLMNAYRGRYGSIFAISAALGACNSFDEPVSGDPNAPRLMIPVDDRAPTQSEVTPVPISGGTLALTSDGALAVASDPDRDVIHIVDLRQNALIHLVELESGAQPGRVVFDSTGQAHVALRGAGAVLSLDTAAGTIRARRDACLSPRGLAVEPLTDVLHVACAEGNVVSFAPDAASPTRVIDVAPDLRDVVVRGSELWVTRFKSAELVRVSADGVAAPAITMPKSQGELGVTSPDVGGVELRAVTSTAGVAWRANATADGGAVIIHQEGVEDEVELSEPTTPNSSAYGGSGGGMTCGGIVRNRLSFVSFDGSVKSTTLIGAPLPVDVAISPDSNWIAVAHAGLPDLDAPRPRFVFPEGEDSFSSEPALATAGLAIVSRGTVDVAGNDECVFPEGNQVMEPVVAVAFAPDGTLVAQVREPASLLVLRGADVPWGNPTRIWLPGDSRADTGHDLFHRDSGGGIACASCHPEGAEDGRVWRFSGVGERRTQALHVGLEGTAPFHWDGDLRDLGALVDEVFVGRMGGVRQSPERLGVLTDFLFSIERPPAMRTASDPAVLEGKALFESESVGCSSCHAGASLTNSESVDVGTLADGTRLQVPSLVAVSYRAPFMHDGCAQTLADRFDPACGGSSHGHTEQLTATEVDSLIAYLESL